MNRVKLAVAVGAMVLAFVALVALANGLLGWAGGLFADALSFQMVLGWVFAPVMYLLSPGSGRRRRGFVRYENRAERVRRVHRSRCSGWDGAE